MSAQLRTAAQQALEALIGAGDEMDVAMQDAFVALRAALAQPDKTNQCAETCERAKLCAVCASGVDDVNHEPVAWRTFDGEGGYEYRSYEDNENYREEYIKRNGEKYASWVEPLYTALKGK